MFSRVLKSMVFSIILSLFWTIALFADEAELSFYVSTMGNDSWSGQLPSPNTHWILNKLKFILLFLNFGMDGHINSIDTYQLPGTAFTV